MVTGIKHCDPLSPCYFSIVPPSYDSQSLDHFSVETPGPAIEVAFGALTLETPAHPGHPLLAQREAISTPSSPAGNMSSAGNFLSLQTAAAHGNITPSRPRPKPTQNVLHVTSDDSSSSSSSSSSTSSYTVSTPDTARCSRCQRTPSIDVRTGKCNMVQYGLNLYYCSRCAAIVGLFNR